jgi:hypothetical protein
MQGCRYYSRMIITAALIGGTFACADALGPNRSPDVLGNAGGAAARDSTPSLASDTTLPSNRLRGMVVATSPDSTAPWRPVASVRLEAAQRDARTGAMVVVATTTSDAAGRFAFDKLDVPTGLVFVRAMPAAGTSYRASRWLAGYAFVGPWFTVGAGDSGERLIESWTFGPYVVLERAEGPQREYAPVLLIGRVVGDIGRAGIAGAGIVIDRAVSSTGGGPPTPGGIVASGRTDGNGFFLIELPGPGLYFSRVTAPAGSPFRDVPNSAPFTASANAEATRINYSEFIVGRR